MDLKYIYLLKNSKSNGYQYLYFAIFMMLLLNTTVIFEATFGVNVALIKIMRYCFGSFSTVILIIGIYKTYGQYNYKGITKLCVILLVLVTLIIVLRGFPKIISEDNNYIYLKKILSGELLFFFLPLTLLSQVNLDFIRKVFWLGIWSALFYLAITFLQLHYYTAAKVEFYESLTGFAAGATILVLTFTYHSKKIKFSSVAAILSALIIMAIYARRNKVLYFGSVLSFAYLAPLMARSIFTRRNKQSLIFFSTYFFVTMAAILSLFGNHFDPLIERSKHGFSSRKIVVQEFVKDFNSHPLDWIYGRGMFGNYSSSLRNKSTVLMKNSRRSKIENGYLYHILHGGGLYLSLIIIIILPAIFLGFFKSKNILSKAFASVLTIYLVDMLGFGLPSTDLKFFYVWMSVPFCYSNHLRNYPDYYLLRILRLT